MQPVIPARKATVAVTGSHGLIGSALVAALKAEGHSVRRIPHQVLRDPPLDGVDAVVHLAGEPIAEGRWTADKKKRIRESRVDGTRALCEALARQPRRPRVLVSGSAIGIYGDRGTEPLTEESAPGRSFLAEVTAAWEQATLAAREAGLRVVHLRTGLVLHPSGGLLKRMLPLFRWGLGGRLGTGAQRMSWISLADEVSLVRWALEREDLEGPLNAVAPTPVSNAELTRTLAKVLRRPAVLPVPRFVLRLALGAEKAAEVTSSAKVLPERALQKGHAFEHPELEGCLRALLR